LGPAVSGDLIHTEESTKPSPCIDLMTQKMYAFPSH